MVDEKEPVEHVALKCIKFGIFHPYLNTFPTNIYFQFLPGFWAINKVFWPKWKFVKEYCFWIILESILSNRYSNPDFDSRELIDPLDNKLFNTWIIIRLLEVFTTKLKWTTKTETKAKFILIWTKKGPENLR